MNEKVKIKTIIRSYYSKKAGGMVTKTYTYDASRYKNTRSKPDVIVYKSGKVNQKNYEKFLSSIPKEDIAARQDFMNIVKFRSQNKEKLSETYFTATKEKDKIKRMFINLGYSYQEAAKEINVDQLEILNEENWDKNIFKTTDKEGHNLYYRVVWNYNKNVFKAMTQEEIEKYEKTGTV